jgi:hypothetical protein
VCVCVFAHEWCSQVRAKGSGAMPDDSGNVSGAQGLHKESTSAS